MGNVVKPLHPYPCMTAAVTLKESATVNRVCTNIHKKIYHFSQGTQLHALDAFCLKHDLVRCLGLSNWGRMWWD